MNVKTPTEGANSLTKNALDHCIFPITPRDDIEKYGPMIMASGSGVHVVDIHGKTYLDMMSSSSRANSLGYGNEEIARAMYEQAKTLHYIGSGRNVTEPMVKLATRIAELAPGRLSKVMFVSGGSEAVETAFKIAKQYHQASGKKPSAYKIISRWNAFHGATMGALSATDWLPVRETIDPRVPGYSFVGNPMSYRNPLGMSVEDYEEFCANHLERQIQLENPELVAAFIGEPIMQANGAQVPSKTYWRRVREICTKYDVLMIVDEIITGFGRAGHWFVSEHFGIEPDIMTSAKALTAGYMPMGAVITRDEIADAMPIFRHVHTFSGHAVGRRRRQRRHRHQDAREPDPQIPRKRQVSASRSQGGDRRSPDGWADSRHGKLARGRLHLGQENEGRVRRRHGEENCAAHARSWRDRERDRHEH